VVEFVPLDGILLTMWLDGLYSQVITLVKTVYKKTPGKVQSIRLQIAGKAQNRALKASAAEWETYMVYVYPEDAVKYIDGFLLRIVRKKH
jgi:hypothetical protein